MYADAETGLYYWGARYYDPRTGRSISADPMSVAEHAQLWRATLGTPNQLPLELNPYAYVDGNPVRFADPLGLWTFQMGFSGSYYATLGGVGIGVTGGFGFAIDGHGNITTYGYGGKGGALGTPGASGGVQIAVSNGNTVCDLVGPFNNANLGGGWGPDATGDAFWGTGSQGQRVEGGGLTIGGGIGGSAFVGQTNTQLGNIGHLW
ncbi:MAG: RHS repeat-associated core domain-containing protein [Sulfuricaulis sp.]